MRRYEVTCVLAPTLSVEEVEQAVASFKKTAEDKGATVVDIDNWGKRRLAFPVKKHTEGYYVIYTLDEEAAEAANEMERRFKVTEPVIRFLTVRIDEAQKRAEKLKAQREKRTNIRKAALAAARAAEAAPSAEAAGKAEEKAAPAQEEAQAAEEKEEAASEAAEKPHSEPESSDQSEEEAPAEEAPPSEGKE
ncbi:MAG: 30S ribosomal protein S6 [Acidobacteriota bacterium]